MMTLILIYALRAYAIWIVLASVWEVLYLYFCSPLRVQEIADDPQKVLNSTIQNFKPDGRLVFLWLLSVLAWFVDTANF